MLTDERQFWTGAATGIYSFFRDRDTVLTGGVTKPTGTRDSQIALADAYSLASRWADVGNSRLIENARYLLVEVN